jgi:hypothetical protein
MVINRNNYEEFFLMYVDDELTSQQCAEVEKFVEQNPDLRSEFEMLKQTKLEAGDTIEFAHKTELLKIKDSIGLDNYQEYFLLYIDNELNESSRKAVEKFVLQHPQLQNEFTLLKQTILPQEKISFHHKKSLYKKEERRVVYFKWTRIAAAAALVGVATLVWRMAPHNVKSNTDVTTVQHNKQNVKPAQNTTINKDTTQRIAQPSQNINEQVASVKKTQQKNDKALVAKTEKKKTIKPVERNTQKETNIALNNFKKDDTTNATQQLTGNKNDVDNSNPIVANVDNNKVKEEEDPLEKAKSTNAVNTKTPKEIVQPAVYKELNTDEDVNTDNGLYIGNMELNKNQVRGIMKRIGGLFSKSKKSSNEKGKLQVANFELNTN